VRLEILDSGLHRHDVLLRMPFRYGIVTMTDGPVLFLHLRVRIGEHESSGVSSDLLPPKWFTKVPDKPIPDEIAEMLRVIRHAAATAIGLRGESAFSVWRQLYEAQTTWAAKERIPPLLANFGVSLVERALIEAVARAAGRPFTRLLRENILGIELPAIHPSIGGMAPDTLLPERPLARAMVRHTVGLADPLADDEIAPRDRLHDGLPQTLEEGIRRYGLRHFKIKVNGDLARDLQRLIRIAEIIRAHASGDFAFSLDGNEQFKSLDQFRAFWEEIQGRSDLRGFFEHLLFVEQPLHRDRALQPELTEAFACWPGRPPMIIDESDATLDDLPAALELGYAGTSHKNCKGIFKGIAHRCLLTIRQRAEPQRAFVMSGEDLCNIGPVALLQDLTVMSTLGIESIERNGHHYHAGLSQFPATVQEEILRHHGDLYERSTAGWPTLRIERGGVSLDSVNRAPFGVGFELDVRQFGGVATSGLE